MPGQSTGGRPHPLQGKALCPSTVANTVWPQVIFSKGTADLPAEARRKTIFSLLLSFFCSLEEKLSAPSWRVSTKGLNAENSPSFTLNKLQVARQLYLRKELGLRSYRRQTDARWGGIQSQKAREMNRKLCLYLFLTSNFPKVHAAPSLPADNELTCSVSHRTGNFSLSTKNSLCSNTNVLSKLAYLLFFTKISLCLGLDALQWLRTNGFCLPASPSTSVRSSHEFLLALKMQMC